ncbi:Protein of unknown function [Pyronema omphalodes CBS 100304]|uniref:Uncharacterized protein n=1 Tax=Pyronema omphalodes (strain CBS 100304) TaxID=1076935 RepID=U4L5N0_PYROM|nr:Protein of unknown function [Pyronema omphalodes CBS 100304]
MPLGNMVLAMWPLPSCLRPPLSPLRTTSSSRSKRGFIKNVECELRACLSMGRNTTM